MAYAVPQQFYHGIYPTAAMMNKFKDGLDAIYGQLGNYAINPLVAQHTGTIQGFYFSHRCQWLLYKGDGTIEDPSGVGETVNISGDAGGGWSSYDLTQVDWLAPGKLYQVQHCDFALEDIESL